MGVAFYSIARNVGVAAGAQVARINLIDWHHGPSRALPARGTSRTPSSRAARPGRRTPPGAPPGERAGAALRACGTHLQAPLPTGDRRGTARVCAHAAARRGEADTGGERSGHRSSPPRWVTKTQASSVGGSGAGETSPHPSIAGALARHASHCHPGQRVDHAMAAQGRDGGDEPGRALDAPATRSPAMRRARKSRRMGSSPCRVGRGSGCVDAAAIPAAAGGQATSP